MKLHSHLVFGIPKIGRTLAVMGLAFTSLTPVTLYADDDNPRETPSSQGEVDCNDQANLQMAECQTQTSTQPTTPSEPMQETSAPPPPESPAATGPGSPRDVLFNLADAGKEATQYKNDEGTDAKGAWARVRYERRTDTGSADTFGPRVIDHQVFIAKDVETARQIFQENKDRNATFPEQDRNDARGGTFPWNNIENLVEQTVAISACNDCNAKDQVMLHHRIVQQRGRAVSVLYLYGRDKRGNEEITTQNAVFTPFVRKVADRM